MTELTFILSKGEKILKDSSSLQYAGPSIHSTGAAFGSTLGGGLGAGIISSKQTKREGSIWDAKFIHVYLSNKRIIFCHAKQVFFSTKEKSIGNMLSEIEYKNIKGINSSLKFVNPAIDIAVAGPNGIDNIKFWFLGTEKARGKERDEYIKLIKSKLK